MTLSFRTIFSIAVIGTSLCTSGCGGRDPIQAKFIDDVPYGVTAEPFRERWWQYNERGVSWANGGFWTEAEADLRQCLALHQNDARRARTYGMHFIQCFAHRELGAVLIEQGRFDEAKEQLEISMAQEPSAKAAFLLRRVRQLLGEQALQPQADTLIAIDPALATAAADNNDVAFLQPDLLAIDSHLVIENIEQQGDNSELTGHFIAPTGTPLWLIPPQGPPAQIPVSATGAFTVFAPHGGQLASGGRPGTQGQSRPAQIIMEVAKPSEKPLLKLNGPSDGATVQTFTTWYRFSAEAPQGLREVQVFDENNVPCGNSKLSGKCAGGMLAVSLTEGEHRLRFVLTANDGNQTSEQRQVIVNCPPWQRRDWRATTMLIALQPSGMGQSIKEIDPAYYERAVVHSERFNLIAEEGAALRQREVDLAQAGLVTPTTAVRVGRDTQARYVLLGTLTRGRNDAECFVRLVNCATGKVVATADAYDQAANDFNTQAFYTAVASRLRQAFPVFQQQLREQHGEYSLALGYNDGVCDNLRFHLVDADSKNDLGMIEIIDCQDHASQVRWLTAPSKVPALAISE